MKFSSLKPSQSDPKDKLFGFHRVFGSVSLADLPAELSADAGLTMPDQNQAGDGTECTSYLVCDMATDQDGVEYEPDIQYAKTLLVMGAPPTQEGADLRSAFKVPVALGLLPKDKVPAVMKDLPQAQASDWKKWPVELDLEMAKHKKPAYFPISGPYDFFDNVRSAMTLAQAEKRTVGIGTPWYSEFESVGRDGILEENPTDLISWHAYKIGGWTVHNKRGKTIRGGETFLAIKSWQGPNFGDKGWVYMSRPLVAKLMKPYGTYGAMYRKVTEGTIADLKAQRITYLEVALSFAQNLLITLRTKLGRS